ncbi:hypothetical protein [Lactobacillus kitasatonis]|uniref:hypothetical protein n=1 Tax=Lactobacillus kitasatonis TaxID=237446 RepID=UPI003F67D431
MNRFNAKIARLYQEVLSDVNKDIAYDLARVTKAAVDPVRAAELTAKLDNVRDAAIEWQNTYQKERANKDDDKEKDLMAEIQLLKYSMWLGRDYFLKAEISANLLKLGIKHNTMLNEKLIAEYKKEAERQAGIMKITLATDFWRRPETLKRMYSQVNSGDFSNHVWANVDTLQAELTRDIAHELVQGRNPREFRNKLGKLVADDFKHGRYAGERIARTETARVQYTAAMDLFREQDQKYVMWTAESVACRACKEIAERDDAGVGEAGVYKLNDVPELPVHPNCRCSIVAWYPDRDGEKVDLKKIVK